MAYDLAMELDRLERDAELVLLCPSTSSDEEEEDVNALSSLFFFESSSSFPPFNRCDENATVVV